MSEVSPTGTEPGELPEIDVAAFGIASDLDEVAPQAVAIGIPMVLENSSVRPVGGVPPELRFGDRSWPTSVDESWLARYGFNADSAKTLVARQEPGMPSLILVGLGEYSDASSDRAKPSLADAWRQAAASLVRAGALACHMGSGGEAQTKSTIPPAPAPSPGDGHGTGNSVVLLVGSEGQRDDIELAAQAAVEGALLSAYRFDAHKESIGPAPDRFVLLCTQDEHLEAARVGAGRGEVLARATSFARDLANEPPSQLTPRHMAERVRSHLEGRRGVTVEVWDEKKIEAERLGGIMGVARGSAEPPRLLIARYRPALTPASSRVPHVALVGKGITFDSGGLSLKSAGGMTTMKTDMSGAAAVMAALGACSDLGVEVEVSAVAPLAENMPGGRAIKPGDVLTARNGVTIEVLNTDAEGRLVLADALCLVSEMQPDAVVDIATLTGACVVALGKSIAGLFSDDDRLAEQLLAAGERAGEPSWRLPLPDSYRSHIDSEVADIQNIGKEGQAGAIAGALFLARFARGLRWAHLDIAGPARCDEDFGIFSKGATGFGVRTLVELVRSWERFGSAHP